MMDDWIRPARRHKKFHSIRKLTSNNQTGDAYGITIPKYIAKQFIYSKLNISVSGNCIIIEKIEV